MPYAYDDETNQQIDPDATAGDLGSDPLAYASRRLTLAKELWERWEARPLKSGESYAALRRNISRGITQVRESGLLAARFIGGISVLRESWGLGLGRRMLEMLIDWAARGGVIRKINLGVAPSNTRAIALYESLGFVVEGRMTRSVAVNGVLDDTLLMGLAIDPVHGGGLQPGSRTEGRDPA